MYLFPFNLEIEVEPLVPGTSAKVILFVIFLDYICSLKERRLRTKLRPFWPQLWPQSWPQPRGCPIQQCQYYEGAAVTTRIMSRFTGHNSRCYRRPFIVLAHCCLRNHRQLILP